jgi:hypothetical protein
VCVKNCTVKYPWFDRNLHNLHNNDNNQCLKKFEIIHELYWVLWRNFRSLYRLLMNRNAIGCPSSIFLEKKCARDSQSIANLTVASCTFGMTGSLTMPYQLLTTVRKSSIEISGDEGKCVFLGWDVNNGSFHLSKFLCHSFSGFHCMLGFFLPFGSNFLLFIYSRTAMSGMYPGTLEYHSCQPFQKYSKKIYAVEVLPSFVLSYLKQNIVL